MIRQRDNRGLAAGVVLASLTTVICLIVVEASPGCPDSARGALALPAPGQTRPHLPAQARSDLETRIEAWTISIRSTPTGMRWREAPTEKPAGSTRIAFVGDSFTFGQWASTAERSLVGVFDAEMRPLEVDVLNFGVPGYGFLEIEEQLETDVSAFHPDYIALVSFNGNDFMDTYVGFSRYEIRPNGTRQFNGDNIAERSPRRSTAAAVTSPCSKGIYLFNIVRGRAQRRGRGRAAARRGLSGRAGRRSRPRPCRTSSGAEVRIRPSPKRRATSPSRPGDRGVRRGERRQADHHRA